MSSIEGWSEAEDDDEPLPPRHPVRVAVVASEDPAVLTKLRLLMCG
ncbi:MAG: hypothetical protein SV760_06180 [Halobacteria archaeon]|nr:hypothetical protein [Halobacteria archaeon]